MDKIYNESLQEFTEQDKIVLNKIKDYRFDTNFEIIQELFSGDKICKKDLIPVTDGKDLYLLLSLFDMNDDEYRYLFNAYNVYIYNSLCYNRIENLTRKWRKIMKNTYPASWYVEDVKDLLQNEKAQRIEAIVNEIDEQINEL